LATTSTARSKRDHASGSSFIPLDVDFFTMADKPRSKKKQTTHVASIERKTIPPEILAAIGEIVIKASDLDDLLSLLIFRFTKFVYPEDGFIILGRLSVSEKVKRLSKLVEKYADTAFTEDFDTTKKAISKIFMYRNAFAHGVFQGMDSADGALVFALTANNLLEDDGSTGHASLGVLPNDILQLAKVSGHLVQRYELAWKLKGWRAKRYAQHLRLRQPGQRPR
jgi:hypothetical protein